MDTGIGVGILMALVNRLDGKVVLITGGTGSFGRAFARKLLTEGSPSKVIIFSRDEWKQWEMQRADPVFEDKRIRFFLGDIRDKDRLLRAFHGVDVVVHAAALKQVPAAEYNPSEFVKTNVLGAMNIIDAAIACGVERVIALSTDKAVNPINLYGATKLCSDKLFVAGGVYVGTGEGTRFSVVRYGNVIGSRGSIIPMWKQMVADGAQELPITDPRMSRFWITMDQAIDLVLFAYEKMRGGEIFVPKIPSMRIVDLAEAIAPGIRLKVQGIRPGEKLAEVLIAGEDSRNTREFDKFYVILPEVILRARGVHPKDYFKDLPSQELPEGFVYASDTNDQWLRVADLRKMLGEPSLGLVGK